MLNKRKIFILVGLAVTITAIGILVFILIRNNKLKSNSIFGVEATIAVPTPEFMSDAEKANFNLSVNSKIQVLKSDESGKTEVYRIIRKDADIILDPSRIADQDMTRPASQSVQQ